MNDLISRQAAIDALKQLAHDKFSIDDLYQFYLSALLDADEAIRNIPSAEQESFEWCHDCKEYDQDAHCCHRWVKQIHKTVEELQVVRCKDCKHYESNISCVGGTYSGCWEWDNDGNASEVEPDEFCSRGERKQ